MVLCIWFRLEILASLTWLCSFLFCRFLYICELSKKCVWFFFIFHYSRFLCLRFFYSLLVLETRFGFIFCWLGSSGVSMSRKLELELFMCVRSHSVDDRSSHAIQQASLNIIAWVLREEVMNWNIKSSTSARWQMEIFKFLSPLRASILWY